MNTQLEQVLCRHKGAGRDSLIPILQEVQKELGYLSRDAVVAVGQHLNLPASKVYGVATFYNQFRFAPKGRCHIMVCRGTACHVKGSLAILETLKKLLRIEAGQTTRDGAFSLEEVACIGACGLAPVINVNGRFYAKLTPDKLTDIIQELKQKEAAHVQA